MKKYLLILGVLASHTAIAQNEIGAMIGGGQATGRPGDVDHLQSSFNGFYYTRSISLSKYIGLKPGLMYYSTRHIMDGHFNNLTGYATFERTPDNYKLSTLTMDGIMLPVMAELILVKNERGSHIDFNLGGYADYLISGVQRYKTGTTQHKSKAPIDNRLNGGAALELAMAFGGKTKRIKHIGFSCAIFYQLTEYSDNGKSFKPLMSAIKLGSGF